MQQAESPQGTPVSKLDRQIRQEISQWQQEGLITADQADALRLRYPEAERREWSRIVPMAAGAVIFGLGVILFFAYNWDGMHRLVKLGFIGLGLVGLHGAGVYCSQLKDSRALSDSLHLAGTMFFGAGIWLVAQIYHIDEHYPNAFLIWSVVALATAWTLPSMSHGLLAVALAFMWGCFEIFDFSHTQHPASWLVALGAIPLAVWLRSNVLVFFAVAAFVLLHGFSLINLDDDLVFTSMLMLGSAMLAGARLIGAGAKDEFQPDMVLRRLGLVVWIVLVFVGTFMRSDFGDMNDLPQALWGWVYWSGPILLAVGAWAAVYVKGLSGSNPPEQGESATVVAVMAVLLIVNFSSGAGGLAWVVFNLAFLAFGAITLSRGLNEVRWGLTALGTLMLAVFVFARFMDLFDSLLARSAVFVAVGVGLFAVGQMFSRRKQRQQEGVSDA